MSVIVRVPPPPPAARTRTARGDAHAPSLGEFVQGALGAVDGMVIGGTVFPGLLLCVPAILFVVAPLVLIGGCSRWSGCCSPPPRSWSSARAGSRRVVGSAWPPRPSPLVAACSSSPQVSAMDERELLRRVEKVLDLAPDALGPPVPPDLLAATEALLRHRREIERFAPQARQASP